MVYKEINTPEGVLRVSGLAIGSAVKMGALSQDELFDLYDCYLEHGGNCIDTARAYGGGQAEALVGEYIRSRCCRNALVLSTKCAHPGPDGKSRLSYKQMKADLEQSLSALGTDVIDIYWVHKDDENVPVEAVIDALNRLYAEGKIRMFGASNWKTERIEAANRYAAQSGQIPFMASQIQWSLAETLSLYFEKFTSLVMDDASYQWYRKTGMPVFAYSPQAQGFFQKVEKYGLASLDMETQRNYGNPENMRRLARAKAYADAHKVPLMVPILGYLMSNAVTCVPVIGSSSREKLLESLMAGENCLSREDAEYLEGGEHLSGTHSVGVGS